MTFYAICYLESPKPSRTYVIKEKEIGEDSSHSHLPVDAACIVCKLAIK